MISKRFVLAGRAVFTLEVPADFIVSQRALGNECKPHYTFRVNFSENYGGKWFVNLLTGPDNTRSYSYVGELNPETGAVKLTPRSTYKITTLPVRLLQRVLANVWAESDALEHHGFSLHHVGKCGRCGRPLTVPASILSGIGPECAKK